MLLFIVYHSTQDKLYQDNHFTDIVIVPLPICISIRESFAKRVKGEENSSVEENVFQKEI